MNFHVQPMHRRRRGLIAWLMPEWKLEAFIPQPTNARVFLGYQGRTNPADPAGALIADPAKPIMGPTETNYDFWASYRRRIFADKVSLKLQLNIRNAFVNDELIPIRAQQADVYSKYPAFDHYKATNYQLFRIAAPRTIQLTATFGF